MNKWMLVVVVLISLNSCFQDNDTLNGDPSAVLLFSADTLQFDTLLTGRVSTSRRFRITNPGKNSINISSISLTDHDASGAFRLIINGKEASSLSDIIITGGDSVLVLVTAQITPQNQNLPFIIEEQIITRWNGNERRVLLTAYGQDAVYFTKQILCDTLLTADKPYVFTDTVLIQSGCKMTVAAGARLFFDRTAALFIGGSLQVNGQADEPVTFRNSRMDEAFKIAPGQWGGIYFLEGSGASEISFATIENAITGIYLGTPDTDTLPDLVIRQSIIRHHSFAGVQAFTSDLIMENCLMYDAGSYLLVNAAGGHYQYIHCTFSNFPASIFSRNNALLISDNIQLSNQQLLQAAFSVQFINSILWSEDNEVLTVSETLTGQNRLIFARNLIRTGTNFPDNITGRQRNLPGFLAPLEYNYRPDSVSPVINQGLPGFTGTDLTGKLRNPLPDIGAYEFHP